MQMSIFNIFSILVMLISSFLSLYINNLFIMWILLEISSMTFSIMLNYNLKKKLSILYFFISHLTSICIIMCILIKSNYLNTNFMLTISLWLKLGMFPLNYWMNMMMKNMSYQMMIPLLIYTKFIPMIMFMMFININYTIMMILLLSLFFPTILAFNTSSFFLLLNYSSMYHMSLIILISLINSYASILYFMFYSISTFILIKMLDENKIYNKNSLNILINSNNKKIYSISMFLYAQLPPFTAFSMKWFMIENLNFEYLLLFSIVVMISTVIMTFNYLTFMNISFYNYSMKFNYKMKYKTYTNKISFYLTSLILIFMFYIFNFMFI